MKRIFLGATILLGLSGPSWASTLNEIRIDAGTAGSVTTLSITQDAGNPDNAVTKSGGAALPVTGKWNAIAIDQTGATNRFYGNLKSDAASTVATLSASYLGGSNTHTLTVGNLRAPVDPAITVNVANSGGATNTITDTLNGASLSYNLGIAGSGNTVTNTVSVSGAITLTQGGGGYGISGDNNSVTNTVDGVASFTHNLTILGSNNTIQNTASTGGDKTITQLVTGDGNSISMTLNAGGNQSATLLVPADSKVDFDLQSQAIASSANVNLSDVRGAAGAPAVIKVVQTSAADGATANLTINGNGFTMGTALTGGSGIYVNQASSGAMLNANVTANANGYTANFIQ